MIRNRQLKLLTMESVHDIRIEQLFIPAKNNNDAYWCVDFVIHPSGKNLFGGYLMGIIEIRATEKDYSQKISQILVNTVQESYYQQITNSPDPAKLNLETVFEYALQKANSAITELIQIGQVNFVLDNLNYVVAVAKPNNKTKDIDFFFTQQGLTGVYLLHKTKQNNYKVINIVDNSPANKAEKSSKTLKVFSSTLAGNIFFHDILFFCSEMFNNFLPVQKVNKVIAGGDFNSSIDYFKTLINNVKNSSHLSYSAIFIKMEEKKTPHDRPISHESIDRLINTKEQTEKYLTQSNSINIISRITAVVDFLKKIKTKKTKLKTPERTGSFGKKIIQKIKSLIITLKDLFTGKKTFSFKKLLYPFKTLATLSKNPRYSKKLLLGLILIIVALVGSIFWTNHNKKVAQIEKKYRTQIQNTKDLINKAQVGLITKSETEAFTFLSEAEIIIAQLPQNDSNQQANFQELNKQAQNIREKLLKIENIIPEKLFETEGSIKKIVGQKNSLFIVADNSLWQFDLNSKALNKRITELPNEINYLVADDKTMLALFADNKLTKIEGNSLKNINLSLSAQNPFTLYNGHIYQVDKEKEQIIRFTSLGNDQYASAKNWLKESNDSALKLAGDICADGNLYVAGTDGKINKYFTGKKEPFSSSSATTKPIKIITSIELDKIYLLNKESNLIVILNKDGSLYSQYQFSTLENSITDFFVNKDAIYIISNNTVYRSKK